MLQPTPTSAKRILRPGETKSTYFPAASPALRFPRQENAKELPTTATCGLRCIEQFSKSDRAGLWQKTFSALLIGTKGWFSNRCTLTWKLRDTPYKRSYFQLAASTPRTSDTEHGLLPTVTMTNSVQGFHSTNGTGRPLLPMAALMLGTPTAPTLAHSPDQQTGRTPNMAEFVGQVATGQLRMVTGEVAGHIRQMQQQTGFLLKMNHGLLPTPTCSDMKGGQKVEGRNKFRQSGHSFTSKLSDLAYSRLLPTPKAGDSSGGAQMVDGPTVTRPSGQKFSTGLRDRAHSGLLPTPTARCHNTGTTKPRKDGISRLSELNHLVACSVGKGSQLSPLYCEEMMGFPKYYTALPFLDGAESR